MKAKSNFNQLITICVFSTLSVTALAQEDQAKESIELSPTPLMKQAAYSRRGCQAVGRSELCAWVIELQSRLLYL